MHKKRLAAGLCPDPLGELTALPRPPGCIRGRARKGGGERHEGMETGGRGQERRRDRREGTRKGR